LSAKVLDGSICKPRQSVQDELTDFFAGAAVEAGAPSKVPAKGSIMSFFKAASNPSSAAKATSSPAREKHRAQQAQNASAAGAKVDEQKVEWQCQVCTFINSKKIRTSYMACAICHNLFDDGECSRSTFDVVSPDTAIPNSQRRRVASSAGSARPDVVAVQESANSSISPKTRKRSPSSGKSSRNEVVVIDEAPQFVSQSISRRRKTFPNEVVVIDIEDDSPVKPEQSSTVHYKEMLAFSVSKNSGRITLHYKDTGVSTQVNFDIHEVVTKETAYALEEAQLKRSAEPRPLSLSFDEKAVRISKFAQL
jgi:hypothetical protein